MAMKLTIPDRMATGQPANSASAAATVAQTKNMLRFSRIRVTVEMRSVMTVILTAHRFQFLNYENPAGPLDILKRPRRLMRR